MVDLPHALLIGKDEGDLAPPVHIDRHRGRVEVSAGVGRHTETVLYQAEDRFITQGCVSFRTRYPHTV